TAPIAPEILTALGAANEGPAPAYGGDDFTAHLKDRLAEVFERPCHFALVATGSAANGIALSLASPPYGQVLCHEGSHITLEEGGAPEFYTGGAKLAAVPGAQGKLTVEGRTIAIDAHPPLPPHVMPRSVLSLTQATELGTVYTREELGTLSAWARSQRLKVHMDGARFANAVVSTGASAAELSWQAGIDLLSFGATKNGALAAELLLVFDDALAEGLAPRQKRAGHLWSKQRYLAAQMLAYLEDDLWLRLAAHANAQARRLSEGLAALPGVILEAPTEANEVFVHLPLPLQTALRAAGATFYPWHAPGLAPSETRVRLVTHHATAPADVEAFLAFAQKSV
ncbi:MAG: threonine aldolase family protein, partial [Pseudomonadales bacterium]